MKTIFAFIFFIIPINISAQSLSDILFHEEPSIDQRYYKLLPQTKEKDADITFIRSREPENMSLEDSFLKMIALAFDDAETIIETGTYKGHTTKKMARRFKQVHSIELGKDLYEQASKQFEKDKNIILHLGDSAKLLPKIVKQLKTKTVFFLDAHFSLGETAVGDENTPILAELDIIKKAHLSNSVIIIDDIRMFYKSPISAKDTFIAGYPTINDLVDALLEINSSYQLAIVYDTLIAFPATDNITVSPLVKAITMSRLYTGTNYEIEHILTAELCISRAKGKEKETLIDLGQRWLEPWSYGSAISEHLALWCGLIFMETEEYAKAYAYFIDAKRRGMCHWRLDWYMIMAQANCFFDISPS